MCCVHMYHSEYAAFNQAVTSSLRDQCEKGCWLLEAECVALQHRGCGCHGPVVHRWLQTEVTCTAAPVINLDLLRGLLPSMVTERHHRLTGGDGCVGLECVGRLVGACFAGHLLPSTDLDGLPCRTTTTHRSAALTHCDPHVTFFLRDLDRLCLPVTCDMQLGARSWIAFQLRRERWWHATLCAESMEE